MTGKEERSMPRGPLLAAWAAGAALFAAGCSEPAHEPAHYPILELSGTPYEQGFQHGSECASRIRSLYTQLLTSSLLPWLNREQPGIEDVLVEYQKPLYDDGQFSYQILLQSGQNLLKYIPESYQEEMHGIADGAGLPFDQILVLNTFMDTLLALRSIVFLLNAIQAPHLLSVEFLGNLGADGADNDGDGTIDEPDEGRLDPYEPASHASLVEVPGDARIRMVLKDPQGVAAETIRVQLDERLYTAGDPSIQTTRAGGEGELLDAVFTPPDGLPPASALSLVVKAGDESLVTDPPPSHARFMRDERIVFTTRGYGKTPHQVPNEGVRDDRFQPPSIGFAARGSATADGRMLLAHHFALLDSNTSHKHTALFIHRPPNGKTHLTLGWTGLIWGISGMNEDGLVYAATVSDTLDNPMTKAFLDRLVFAKLLLTGVPMGILGREVLAGTAGVDEAKSFLENEPKTYGWNFLLADRSRKMAAAEVDSDILEKEDGGFLTYTPETGDPANLDPWGEPWASVGPDDLRIGSHFQRNTEDIDFAILGLTLIPPQRSWTSYYFKSLRAFFLLGDEISAAYGALDVERAIEILRIEDLADQRDSMIASVYEPESLMVHFAMGEEPATSGPFRDFDLGAVLSGGAGSAAARSAGGAESAGDAGGRR